MLHDASRCKNGARSSRLAESHRQNVRSRDAMAMPSTYNVAMRHCLRVSRSNSDNWPRQIATRVYKSGKENRKFEIEN